MKFILAPDKYKGSLTGIEFCNAVEEGIKSVLPKAEIVKMPLADGGDGTIDILNYHLKGEIIKIKVNDPLFRSIEAPYLLSKSSQTAFIEMAQASGMHLLSKEEQNCFHTTSYGTGELIHDAIKKGVKTIVLGIGGSATNDCGIGMASALGYKFIDKNGKEINPIGKNLLKIHKIDASNVIGKLKTINFKIASDVTNPLYGKNGAAFIYAPQKGANTHEIKLLNQGLENIANIIFNQFNINVQKIEGSGAAGGMGAGGIAFLNANLLLGIELIKELIDFDNKIKDADWVITGEGKLDQQTFSGKTIQGVMTSAKKYNIPVAAFCGSISLLKKEQSDLGISYVSSIIEKAKNLDDAIANSYKYLKIISTEFGEKIS
ncbi:MAG: glycerate kinase [Flavobacteriaceae bacterium]|nr:glycerate kinase [Flavobacteriaceae bacterium]